MTFKYDDRLTRAEAQQLEAWARSNPEVVRAYVNNGHPENGAVRLYVDMVRHFQYERELDAAGEPTPWPAPTAEEARALPDNIFGAKTAQEAAALLAWAKTKPEYREAYLNKEHPQHKDYVEQTRQLMEIVHPTPVADPGQAFDDAAGIGQPSQATPTLPLSDEKTLETVRSVAAAHAARERGGGLTPQQIAERAQSMRDGTDWRARIREASKHPAYLDPNHPEHASAVQAVTAAYAALYQPADVGTERAQLARGSVQPQDRIREAQKHPGYLDPKHPEHKAAVEAVTAAYSAAYPAPAAGGAEGAPPGATVH
jgi:hypothetical protein